MGQLGRNKVAIAVKMWKMTKMIKAALVKGQENDFLYNSQATIQPLYF